ncbi:MAG TPA: extracellular solute-binding protein [Bacillota bacterium]|nr:extracellular solute-binding protein [Bacillota bacterium]
MQNRHYFTSLFIMILLLFFACDGVEPREDIEPEDDNFNKTGMPIVDEQVTVKFMSGKSSVTMDNYNDTFLWQEYEKMTNMHIDWGHTPNDSLEHKRTLDIVAGDYPEAYYGAKVPDHELLENGQHGIYLALDDYIDEYMPNLKSLLDDYPEIEKGLTFPDGHIYSLPTIYDPEFTSLHSQIKPYIRKDWLEQLNMDMPETTEEFYGYLKSVKETDVMGNGQGDEIPFSAMDIDHLFHYLKGSFGIGNRGNSNEYIDIDPETGEVRFYPATEQYKDLLKYMHKLYRENLIDQNIYIMDYQEFTEQGAKGVYGSVLMSNPEESFSLEDEYIAMPALEGPNGYKSWTFVDSPLVRRDGFVVTDRNNNIAATLRWVDYFYSEEGAELFFMGKEGETFEIDNKGNYIYKSDLTNSEDLSLEHKLAPYFTYMDSGYPGIIYEQFYQGDASLPLSIEAMEKLKPDMIDEVWPRFTYTKEELDTLVNIEIDLHKTVDEMRTNFIIGRSSIDEWDEYIETLNEIGLSDYLDVKQSAYERYKK